MCTYDAFCNNLRILKKRLQHLIIKQPTHFVIRDVVFIFRAKTYKQLRKNGILLVVSISFSELI